MIFNLIIIALVLGLAYCWMVRGFFNAFMHMLCVLFAGAIAFALWEPLAYMLIGASPERGLLSFVSSAAWGIALILPFVIVLLLLRVITDKIVSAGIKNAGAVDYAGGAVCGLVVGVVCAGITTVGVQSMRLPTGFFGYKPVFYTEGGGSIVHADNLWIPVDDIVGMVYGNMSHGSLSSPEPLAKWYPNIVATSMAARLSPGGAGQNTIDPDDVRVVAAYEVGSASDAKRTEELLKYTGSSTPQSYVDINGDSVTSGYIAGYVLEFEPSAKEKGGKSSKGAQVIMSNGHVSMIAEGQDGKTTNIFPVAMVSEGADSEGQLGRWRFDARDVFISSEGGQSKVKMGFEFVVPAGYTPLALVVRQSRIVLDQNSPKPMALADAGERDRRIRSGSIFEGAARDKQERDISKAARIAGDNLDRDSGIRVTNSIGSVIPSQTARSEVDLDGENRIVTGEAKFSVEVLNNSGPGKNLRVDSYALGSSQSLVQIDVSLDQAISLLDEAARNADTNTPIVLIDSRGNEYEAIGYKYEDDEILHLRFTPGSTLAGLSEVPPISSARADQTLVLLFVVTKGAMIEQVAVGDTVLAVFSPGLEATTR